MSEGGIGERLDALYYELDMRTEGFERGIDEAKLSVTKLTAFVKGNPMLALAALGAAMIAVGYQATEMASEVDHSMRKLQAAMPAATRELSALRQGLEDISRESPHTQAELADMAAEIARMGVNDPSEIMQRLRVGVQIADAASVDLKATLEALDTVSDQFKLSTTEAGHALERMFAITQGKIPLDELFETMQRGGSVLAAFSLTAIDVAESMTALKDAGVQGRQVGSTLLSIMNVVEAAAKGQQMATASQQEAMRTLSHELNPATIATKGFAGAVAGLMEATHGSRDALKQMGFEAKTINGLMRIAEGIHADLRSESDKLAEAQQRVNDAFTINRTDAESLNKIIKNNLNATLIDLGNTILPSVNAGMQTFLGLISKSYSDSQKLSEAFAAAAKGGKPHIDMASGEQSDSAFDYLAERLQKSPNLFKDVPLAQLKGMLETATNLYSMSAKYRDVIVALGVAYGAARKAADDQAAADAKASKARADAASKEEAERQRRAARDLAERQASGIATAQAGFDSMRDQYSPGSEGDIEEKIARLVTAARNAHMAAKEIDRNVTAIRTAVASGAAVAADDLQRTIAAKLADATATQADNFRLTVDQTVAGLRKQLATLQAMGSVDGERLTQMYAQVALIERQGQLTGDVLTLTEQIAKEDRDASTHLTETSDQRMAEYHRLGDQIVKLVTASQAQVEGSAQQATLEEIIAAKKREQAQLLSEMTAEQRKAAEDQITADAKHTAHLERQSRLIQQFGHGIIQAAQAMGLMDQKTAATLENMVQLASTLPLAFSGDPAAIASSIGSALGLISGLFDHSAHDAEMRAIEENNRRLFELAHSLEALQRVMEVQQTVFHAGDDPLSRAQRFLDEASTTFASLAGFKGLNLSSSSGLAAAQKQIQEFFTWYNTLTQKEKGDARIFDGTSPDELSKVLLEMMGMLNELDPATRTAADRLELLRNEMELFDVTNPIDQLKKLATFFSTEFGELAGFDAIDTSTASGRASAKKRLQDLFEQNRNDPTKKDLVAALLELNRLIEASDKQQGDTGTGGYNVSQSITEVTGMRLAGLVVTSNVYLADISATLKAMLSLAPSSGVQPPSLATIRSGALSLQQAAGAIIIEQITLDISVSVQGTLSRDDADALGMAIGQGAVTQINRALATDARLKNASAGTAVLTT